MKGILLAGGHGTRLRPMTLVTSKQLLPVYDKPMVYYPLSTLLQAGIEDILLISSGDDIGKYEELLGDGSQIGISISYVVQEKPEGLPQAFILAEEFIGNENVTMILGDNVYFGNGMSEILSEGVKSTQEGYCNLFGVSVSDPERFGVAEVSNNGRIISIEEKPIEPRSDIAVTGLYMYTNEVVDVAKNLVPSKRGELEISELNMHYVNQGRAKLRKLGKNISWFDSGTPKSLHLASEEVMKAQTNQSEIIGCIEKAAWDMGLIDENSLQNISDQYPQSSEYGEFLRYLMRQIS